MIDRTLTFFSYICYLKRAKILTDEEYKFFEYELKRILLNPGIQNYLYNLYHFAKANKVVFAFQLLYEWGKACGYFDEDFTDPTACEKKDSKYDKYLNF